MGTLLVVVLPEYNPVVSFSLFFQPHTQFLAHVVQFGAVVTRPFRKKEEAPSFSSCDDGVPTYIGRVRRNIGSDLQEPPGDFSRNPPLGDHKNHGGRVSDPVQAAYKPTLGGAEC